MLAGVALASTLGETRAAEERFTSVSETPEKSPTADGRVARFDASRFWTMSRQNEQHCPMVVDAVAASCVACG